MFRYMSVKMPVKCSSTLGHIFGGERPRIGTRELMPCLRFFKKWGLSGNANALSDFTWFSFFVIGSRRQLGGVSFNLSYSHYSILRSRLQ